TFAGRHRELPLDDAHEHPDYGPRSGFAPYRRAEIYVLAPSHHGYLPPELVRRPEFERECAKAVCAGRCGAQARFQHQRSPTYGNRWRNDGEVLGDREKEPKWLI